MEGRTVSHYRILTRLGGGGMGVVYRAEDTRLKRSVALKFLPPDLTRDGDARQRFVQEAQAASVLDHPNICTIYEVDSCAVDGQTIDTQLFIAMAFYDGETLKSRLERGRLSPSEAVDIALQIARGLDNAHQARIVHRDIKPANVMLTNQNLAKIVDFGIAKLVDQTGQTRTGTTLGTVAYMAPEQIAGGASDHRVDLWALGVVFYEMLAGERPFKGDTEVAVIHNIMNTTPADIAEVRPDVPAELALVVRRSMAKRLAERYASAEELVRDLSACQAQLTKPLTVVRETPRAALSPVKLGLAAVIVVAIIWAATMWRTGQRASVSEVDAAIAEATVLADADKYFAALERVDGIAPRAAGDERLSALLDRISVEGPLSTEPPGASVSIKDYRDVDGDWTQVGTTPVQAARLPRGALRWRIELAGYDGEEFISPAPGAAPPGATKFGNQSLALVAHGVAPEGMVLIRRPALGLSLAGYDYTRRIPAPDFLIDKYEVTNRQFKQFVDANGYARPEFWKHPFVKGTRTLTFAEAMDEFRDGTGRPGPATWDVGSYASGKDDYPVGGVSWYEAAAYAEFAGKSLPTVYHWSTAATIGAAAYITPVSNINGKEPARVGAFKGVTGTGAFDMAGNVREWCFNSVPDGSARYHLGGSWADPSYMFTFGDAHDPFDRSEMNGFRLVKYLEGAVPNAVFEPIKPPIRDAGRKPPPAEVLDAYAARYRYDPLPLDAKVESRDESAELWVREIVSFTTPGGKERMTAHLFLPKNARPPYQAALFFPGSFAIQPVPIATMLANPGILANLNWLMMSGRAVIYPVYSGTHERNTWQTSPWPDPARTAAFIEWMTQVTLDARRAVDYLVSRDDIDKTRLAYAGFSWGALIAPRVLAFDDRFKVGVLFDGGAGSGTQTPPYASVDSFNFASRVKQPVLMVNGTEDFIFPVEAAQKPMFAQLGASAEHKLHVILPGGHGILGQQRSQAVREGLNWLEKYLGPVAR